MKASANQLVEKEHWGHHFFLRKDDLNVGFPLIQVYFRNLEPLVKKKFSFDPNLVDHYPDLVEKVVLGFRVSVHQLLLEKRLLPQLPLPQLPLLQLPLLQLPLLQLPLQSRLAAQARSRQAAQARSRQAFLLVPFLQNLLL